MESFEEEQSWIVLIFAKNLRYPLNAILFTPILKISVRNPKMKDLRLLTLLVTAFSIRKSLRVLCAFLAIEIIIYCVVLIIIINISIKKKKKKATLNSDTFVQSEISF